MRSASVRARTSVLLASLLTLSVFFVLVPGTIASSELRAEVEEPDRPVFDGAAAKTGDVHVHHLVSGGETFREILQEAGVSAREAKVWEQAARTEFDVSTIRPQHALHLTFASEQGRLSECTYEIDKYSLLSLRTNHGKITARLMAMPRLAAVRGVAGRVEASLATSATAAGTPIQMVSQLADVFGWEVDLASDVQPGDEFRLLYAELDDNESGLRPGELLAAEVTSRGRKLTALRFEDEKGEPAYYDVSGRPLGRGFLKYPVDFVKISSVYTDARFHPVLRRSRPHRGVDFSAPIGTPVRAVAGGVVTFTGRNGRYGNQVEIGHDSPYSSSYSHLRKIATGVRVGDWVRRGQVVGYVGRSGMTTGPHLHFMLFKDGQYINPLTAKLPGEERLTGRRWNSFVRLRDELAVRLAALGDSVELRSVSLAPLSVAALIRSNVASYAP